MRRETIYKKVRKAAEEVREAGDVYPSVPPPQDNITVVNFIITILYLFKSCSFSINDEISHAMLEGQVDSRTLKIRKHLYIIHLRDSYLPYYE